MVENEKVAAVGACFRFFLFYGAESKLGCLG